MDVLERGKVNTCLCSKLLSTVPNNNRVSPMTPPHHRSLVSICTRSRNPYPFPSPYTTHTKRKRKEKQNKTKKIIKKNAFSLEEEPRRTGRVQ
uniref:Uncharacterized protein n=1 Tax=Oryza rufipogon TaxID=4529 RepID=A0A0E0NPX5_ORYRU